MIECVPNVSEGHDQETLWHLSGAAVRGGAQLIDVHSGVDHHRSVFTCLGEPEVLKVRI